MSDQVTLANIMNLQTYITMNFSCNKYCNRYYVTNLLCRAKWIKFAGQIYKESYEIMIETDDGEYPKFAKI